MKQSEIWREAHRLWKLGAAIHWLHPRSKRPVESGWTTGPRKEWEYLKETYQDGMNVGVRLGTPSFMNGGYLTVVDVDVKSTDERHRVEALTAAKTLLAGAKCPQVRSGRGNGSRHYYCVTEKPFKTFDAAWSDELVKVYMPSKQPSKKERESLSEKEIKEGIRIANAWEISLYSDGRQVVLPPSIHPDSGKPYFWKDFLTKSESLPLLKFELPNVQSDLSRDRRRVEKVRTHETFGNFIPDETLDVRWLPELSDRMREAIVDGVGVEDRSAFLLPATTALVSAGLDRNGVLSVLTDSTTFLGACAYDHAKTKSRERAAQWLWEYTVRRVMRERDPKAAFAGVEPSIELTSELEIKRQNDEIDEMEGENDWKKYLEKTEKGRYRETFNNCKMILTNVCGQKNVLGRDEFAVNDFFLCDTPWRSQKGDPVTDHSILRFKEYCAEKFQIEFNTHAINETFSIVADSYRFHPVRDFIRGLDWDGTPRIETWLQDFAGATGPDAYVRAVSRKVLVAMIKRIFEPGCKFDHVLILEGLQGSGKSTLLSNLAYPWFSDETLNIGDKDAVLTMQSKWLIELGELSALSRSEVETMKAFISRRTDRIRAPYGKRVEEFPRQCIFIGSTNLEEYLRDETGNRRFWPVKCGEIDFERLRAERDQLFAEAYGYYQLGEPVYLDDRETEMLARAEQESRGEVDEWLSTIRSLVTAETFPKGSFEMVEVAKMMEMFGAQKLTPWDQKRIAKCLRFLGFEKFTETKGLRRKLWREKKDEWSLTKAKGALTSLREGSKNSPIDSSFY